MKFLSFSRLPVLLSIIIYFNVGTLSEEMKEPKELKSKSLDRRHGRASLIAFKPFGDRVKVGLDILVPFVKVPTRRKLNQLEDDDALLTINTAALTIGGLISGFGILIGHIFKSLVAPLVRENDNEEHKGKESVEGGEEEDEEKEDESGSAEKRYDVGGKEEKLYRMLEPFKFVYRNSTGGRVDTSLPSLLNTIESVFVENDIDLGACIQKSLCTLVQRSADNMRSGSATGIEKMVDGISQLHWLKTWVRETAIEEAISAGRSMLGKECAFKYPTCKWTEPDKQLYELVSKRVKFE